MPEAALARAAPTNAVLANPQPAQPPQRHGWPMTVADIAMVRAGFALLMQDMDRCAEMFYARLVALDPDIRPRQATITMSQQRRRLMQDLSSLVELLDRPADLQRHLMALARHYGIYGAHDRKFQTARAALAWTVDRLLEPTAEMQRTAWTAALDMAEALLGGAKPRV